MRTSALLAAALVLLGWTAPARAQTSEELVKASFVYRFAAFVQWPARAFADAAEPVHLCVMGAEPFAAPLRRAVAGQSIGERRFDVRVIDSAEAVRACHVLYVGGDRVETGLRAARGLAVLTITDGGQARGMIHFATVDNHVRFHIDDARAAESGIDIDPRLLNLALSVRRRAAG